MSLLEHLILRFKYNQVIFQQFKKYWITVGRHTQGIMSVYRDGYIVDAHIYFFINGKESIWKLASDILSQRTNNRQIFDLPWFIKYINQFIEKKNIHRFKPYQSENDKYNPNLVCSNMIHKLFFHLPIVWINFAQTYPYFAQYIYVYI